MGASMYLDSARMHDRTEFLWLFHIWKPSGPASEATAVSSAKATGIHQTSDRNAEFLP